MDIEDLNKTQVVLLVLFVSFITSIATGIVTVALLAQAPPGVTQTINRVVERTVEKVLPGTTQVQVKEVRVITTEEDLIVQAVSAARPAIVKVYDRLGFLVANASGTPLVFTSRDGFELNSGDYLVGTFDGKERGVEVVSLSEAKGVAVLRFKGKEGMEKFSTLGLASREPALAQTVVLVSPTSVLLGIVRGLEEGTASSSPLISVSFSVPDSKIGAPLLDTKGNVLGMVREGGGVVSAQDLRAILK